MFDWSDKIDQEKNPQQIYSGICMPSAMQTHIQLDSTAIALHSAIWTDLNTLILKHGTYICMGIINGKIIVQVVFFKCVERRGFNGKHHGTSKVFQKKVILLQSTNKAKYLHIVIISPHSHKRPLYNSNMQLYPRLLCFHFDNFTAVGRFEVYWTHEKLLNWKWTKDNQIHKTIERMITSGCMQNECKSEFYSNYCLFLIFAVSNQAKVVQMDSSHLI